MFENPRRGRQARNFTTNIPNTLVLKSSSEQIFSRKLPLGAPETRKTFHLWSTCCSFQKKKRRLLPFFQDFPSIFQHFPCLENCWANFKTFSTIQDTVRALGIDSVNRVWYFTSYTPLHPRTPTDPIHKQSLLAVSSRIPETWLLWKRSSFKFMENITNKQGCNSNTWTCWSPVTTEGMLQLLTQPNQTLDYYLN